MSTSTKLLFIGLDAGERDLILNWGDAGVLPNLHALRHRSLWGDAPAMPGLGSGALWPSFATGVSPSRHGRFFGYQMAPGTYETLKFVHEREQWPPLWQTLSEAGRRVGVINVPYDSLCERLNGLQIVDWAIHNPVHPNPGVWPPEAGPAVVGRAIPHRPCDSYDPEEAGDLVKRLVERIEAKANLACEQLEEGGWDLFMTMFDETHCVGHQCWHLHDPSHPRHDAAAQALGEDPVKTVYQAIDSAVGRLLERVGPETTVIFFSGTGMGPNYGANHLLDEILVRLDKVPPHIGRTIAKGLRRLWAKVPPHLRGRYRLSGRRMEQSLIRPDRGRRTAFAVLHNDISGAIRLNLSGREPQGRIQPGAECEAVCGRLTQDLLEIVNLESGEPLVKEVVRTSQLYPGDHAGDFADLFVVWNRSAPISSVGSPKIGTIHRPFMGNRTGDHTDHGLFMARAEGLAAGRRSEPVSVLDFAPTIAKCLAVPLERAEGRPIGELTACVRWRAEAGSSMAGAMPA